jgi:hypothetical protein
MGCCRTMIRMEEKEGWKGRKSGREQAEYTRD